MNPPIGITIRNLIFLILTLSINYSVGSNVGRIADQQDTLIQPAGYAFSIWGIIYI
ncbi:MULTISPECIES: hypothetical protein [Virgibacillus]|uniref:Uncharacterized protein n=2 Tax=Virgibacillus TaxID=84406 RepID=A0A024QGD3_9BACI|nr:MULTISPECIES: hypothetical protein [Virgibacillus]EQB37137.1 hypothetical protein M948_09655 [Virgibacillus sp. CM-4]MYL43503.1 hypothetical protein [Virgibacillus massiliensis]GGJ71975.1 hypothetical protein GCM10007111_36900 [Virgibacillus kapii]CDQ41270.1 hypothetical protein BN990_03631 [Virgibacillus massiliensis]